VSRQRRDEQAALEIHYGNIALGDEAIRDGKTRDRIASKEEVLCFEIEAAGLMDNFPCLVIQLVSSYEYSTIATGLRGSAVHSQHHTDSSRHSQVPSTVQSQRPAIN
jgi:nucleoside phosphorylase